jgi:hypothetical protein
VSRLSVTTAAREVMIKSRPAITKSIWFKRPANNLHHEVVNGKAVQNVQHIHAIDGPPNNRTLLYAESFTNLLLGVYFSQTLVRESCEETIDSTARLGQPITTPSGVSFCSSGSRPCYLRSSVKRLATVPSESFAQLVEG